MTVADADSEKALFDLVVTVKASPSSPVITPYHCPCIYSPFVIVTVLDGFSLEVDAEKLRLLVLQLKVIAG